MIVDVTIGVGETIFVDVTMVADKTMVVSRCGTSLPVASAFGVVTDLESHMFSNK